MRSFSLIVITLTALCVASCHNSVTTPNGPGPVTKPNTGSYFIVMNTQTDSTGMVTADTEEDRVIATNISIYGETGVTEFLDSSFNGLFSDTQFLIYESNGDVSGYVTSSDGSGPNIWVSYPFASQGTNTWLNEDTSFNVYSRTRVILKSQGAGSGTATVKGQSFSCEKANLIVLGFDTTTSPNFSTDTYTSNSTAWFAPSIGYVVETDQPAFRSQGYLNNSQHSQLIDYHLQ